MAMSLERSGVTRMLMRRLEAIALIVSPVNELQELMQMRTITYRRESSYALPFLFPLLRL